MAAFAHRYLKYREDPLLKQCMPILWPVHVRRVMYPAASDTRLNLFQKAVLGLARARCTDSVRMAEYLGLHPELVLLVIAQCMSNGWLEDDLQLTDNGLTMLLSEENQHVKLKQGLMFQDWLSGAVWPRLSSDLDEIEPLPDSGEFPAFLKDRSSGGRIWPFVLSSRAGTSRPPQPQEIQEAWQTYRRDYRNAKQLLDGEDLPEEVRIHAIDVMDDTPEPMYVLTWVCANPGGDTPWMICDPFDIRERARWLEEPFEQCLRHSSLLAKRVAGLAGPVGSVGEGSEVSYQDMEHHLEMEMLTEYAWVSRHPEMGRFYRALKWRLMEIERGARYGLENTLTDAQKLAESVLQWMIRTWTPNPNILPPSWQDDRRQKVDLLTQLDLPAFSQDVIRRLAGQNLKFVRRAIDEPEQSMKALLFAASLAATPDNPKHPLRAIPAANLALEHLLDLADIRNQASHASATRFTKDKVVSFAQFTLNWTQLFKEWF